MKRSQAFPSKYLSKDDITSPVVATISDVVMETFTSDDEEKTKSVMYFVGANKPMVINVANWMTVESLYGDDSDEWIGKTIEIWVDPSVMYGKKRVGGLRLREPAHNNGNGAAPKPIPAENNDPITAFWQYANANKISKQVAAEYIAETGGDFARALELMKVQAA